MAHPFSWSEFAIADLQVAVSRGAVSRHWSAPEVKQKPVEQVAAEWNDNYARFKAKNAAKSTEGGPDVG